MSIKTPELLLTFEPAILAILYPSHRFRQEGGPYGYGDQVLGGQSLDLELGWNGRAAPAGILWECSTGTIAAPTANPTQYTAPSLEPDENMVVTITVTADEDVRTRDVQVFGDHLGRDRDNFMGGTNTYPLPWWYNPSNCHGASHHAYDGGGTLYENPFACPWGGDYITVYDAATGSDTLNTVTFHRGDILHLDSPWSHSATVLHDGSTSQVSCWMCNGPLGGLFQAGTIEDLIEYGHRRIKWYPKP